MIVKITNLLDSPYGLTVGNIYEITGSYKMPDGKIAYTIDLDDDGDPNEIYDGEFEEFIYEGP